MSYLESLAKNKFGGDIDKARAWLRENGKKGGKTGQKYLQTLSPEERSKLARKANKRSVEARQRRDELEGLEYEETPVKHAPKTGITNKPAKE